MLEKQWEQEINKQSAAIAEFLWRYEAVLKENQKNANAALEDILESLIHRGQLEMGATALYLEQPFLAIQDTVYGSKEQYSRIVSVWRQYDGLVKGWVLLALIDTMDAMSKMIYEHYRELKDLFQTMLKRYLRNTECGYGDVLAGLAIVKACRMDVVLAEQYAQTGLKLIKASRKGGSAAEENLQKTAMEQWEIVKETWGMRDED